MCGHSPLEYHLADVGKRGDPRSRWGVDFEISFKFADTS
jgi:hypothetical protein